MWCTLKPAAIRLHKNLYRLLYIQLYEKNLSSPKCDEESTSPEYPFVKQALKIPSSILYSE